MSDSLEIERVVIRAADEGIPISAIARITKRPSSEVREIVDMAVADGRLLDMPAAEWPADTERKYRSPALAPVRVDDVANLADQLSARMHLTKSEACVFAAIIRHASSGRVASRHALHVAPPRPMSDETDPQIVSVFVSIIRRKIAPLGIEIDTVRGRGYFMRPEMVEKTWKRLGMAG